MNLTSLPGRTAFAITFLLGTLTSGDTVNDFESYASSTALQSDWTSAILPPNPTLDTGIVHAGTKSMKLTPDYSIFAVYVAKRTFASAQDWSAATEASFWYHGQAGNAASIDLEYQLLNSSGQIIVEKKVGRGTETASWQQFTMALSGETGLSDVKTLQIVLSAGFPGDTGVTYIDDLEVEFPGATPGVVVTASGGTTDITEGGATDQLTVAILSEPTHNVTVTPGFNATDLNVTPGSRTISTGSWETPVSFTVSAVDDDVIEGVEQGAVNFTLSSSDPAYSLVTTNQSVTITDNDFLVTPVMDSFIFDGTNYLISFSTEANQRYGLEQTSDLPGSNWVVRTGNLTGLAGSYTIPISPDGTNAIRIVTEPE